ncbi:MAG TPA: CYTH domain-containing protein [Bacilli bacterium]|nr:CYTH domain-containing protein [Bacilli bacterium]
MATNLEIEVKTLLSYPQYQQTLRHFDLDVSDGFIQKNYYIDTNDLALRNLGLSLRIRKLNGYLMTLKLPMAEGLLEKTQILTKEQFLALRKENVFPTGSIYDFLDSLYVKIEKLEILASLSTLRIEVNYGEHKLAIDENRYSDKQDFELEMEATSLRQARETLAKICEEIGFPFVENFESKQKRAFKALKS